MSGITETLQSIPKFMVSGLTNTKDGVCFLANKVASAANYIFQSVPTPIMSVRIFLQTHPKIKALTILTTIATLAAGVFFGYKQHQKTQPQPASEQ